MKFIQLTNTDKGIHRRKNGFALIATLSVMVLLLMIGLAMLSLSTVSLRSEGSTRAAEEARQNARMSLMMAISQLQSLTGPDTRVTASSRLLDEDNVALTGVWRSWEGTDHADKGEPQAPDYDLKRQNGDPSKEPAESDGDGRFLGWLSTSFSKSNIEDLSNFSKTALDDYVMMLGEGSVTDLDDMVYSF